MPSAQFFLSDCQTVFWNESNILKGVKILRIYQMMFSLKKISRFNWSMANGLKKGKGFRFCSHSIIFSFFLEMQVVKMD